MSKPGAAGAACSARTNSLTACSGVIRLRATEKEVLLDPKHTRALVIAPKKFVEKARLPAPLAKVAVEDLAEALNAAAQGLASSTSDPGEALACSYRYRAQALLDLCKSNSPAFSDLHVAFSRA